MVWSDMMENHPEAIAQLPKDIKIVYWNPVNAALFGRHGFTRLTDMPGCAIFVHPQ